MKIVLEVPDSFNALGVTMVWDAYVGCGGCKMVTGLITRDEVKDDESIVIPKEGT